MSPEKSVPIVANPVSGGGVGRARAEAIRRALGERGWDAPIHWTESPGHAEEIARKLSGEAERIVACGGDGTIHQVVNGIRDSEVALAVAPAGRGNDLARVLGVPNDPGAFAEMVAAGKSRRIDLGRAVREGGQVRRFCTVAALGFDAEVARRVVTGGPIRGPGAYIYGVFRTLIGYRPCRVRIEGEFGVFDDEVFLAATANTSTYGGGMVIAPGARPDDGQLSICLIRPVSRIRVLWLFKGVRSGRHIHHPAVTLYQSRSIRITAPSPLELYADGEFLATTPVTLEVDPSALDVLVP
ncbi:MAG: diacylglycerol kinase family lipid kinase [Planctomycetota bacterium]|nr:diacylglycerol kinase family lipid kinase [Planctomycetota bacterium]